MPVKIQLRRDTASNWSSNNPTLSMGELGFVTDTSQLKIGNGSTAWNSLPYFLNSASATTAEIASAVADLIDLSPATLDTLNELAAAIGDDANFFQTIGASVTSASAYALSQANSYTDTEVAEAIVTASAAAVAYADGLTTTDIAEGTNLYFTNQRAIDAASATYILQTNQQGIINTASAAAASYTDGAITSLIDSAPGALNTLNELAAALGDDANFASTIINVVSSASANSISSANSYTDTEVAEAIVTASAAAVAYADGLTTTDISEGTNLYYTNVRGLETASTALVHANHVGLSASYISGEIRFTVTEIDGGGV